MSDAVTQLRRITRELQRPGDYARMFQSAQHVSEYLFRTHCVARASVPLMEVAHEAARARGSRDRVASGMLPYLEQHIEEEREHAQWLLDDLQALGVSVTGVQRRVPPAAVAAGVGAQYYWIQHMHPVALFGYMAVLESSMPSALTLKKAVSGSPLPRAAFRTLRAHAKQDPQHTSALYACLGSLPLRKHQASLVLASATETVGFMLRNSSELLAGLSVAPRSLLARALRVG